MEAVTHWGRYVLVERIGAGATGEVFRGHRLGAAAFQRQVCIKRLHHHLSADPEFVALLLDEASTGSKLRHRNIVAIEDLGKHDGQFFLAMEFVNGLDLARIQDRLSLLGERMPADAGIFIAHEVLAGLECAHTLRDPDDGLPLDIVHRDICPQNVLVSYVGEVKLTDFGLARVARQLHMTSVGTVRGRWGYMPLEQANGTGADARSDIYALGATLYELFAGRRPFAGDNPDASLDVVLDAQQRDDRPSLAQLRPDVPDLMVDAIDLMLAPSPKDRPHEASEVLDVLRSLPETITGGRALAACMAEWFPNQASVTARPSTRPRPKVPSKPPPPRPTAPAPPTHSARPRSDSAQLSAPTPGNTAVARTVGQTARGLVARRSFAAIAGVSVGVGLMWLHGQRASRWGLASAGATSPPPREPNVAPVPATLALRSGPTIVMPDATTSLGPAPGPAATPAPPVNAPQTTTRSRPLASAEIGSLRVTALPWGNVRINGVARGRAPVTVLLRPGTHTVQVSGGITHFERVFVTNGRTSIVRAGEMP